MVRLTAQRSSRSLPSKDAKGGWEWHRFGSDGSRLAKGFCVHQALLLPQPREDFVRTAAMDEDVFVGFKNTLAELTVCFVTQTDVFMEVVCPGVETPW